MQRRREPWGLIDQTLFNWVKAHRQGKLKGADSKPPVSAGQMEMGRLRARVGAREDGARRSGKSDDVLRKRVDLKHALIQSHRRVWPISVQCRVLEVSVAGYHAHFARRASDAQRRHLSDDALRMHIKTTASRAR